MRRVTKLACMLALATLPSAIAKTATAQDVVTTYYPPQATVTYLPVQRGLFGQRISYQPVVGFAPATTVTSYAQAPRVIAGDPVPFAASTSTTYYAPAPVTTYYVSPAYYVAPAPVVVQRVTYYISP